MLELGVKFLLSYFIGSVMGSLVIGRLYGGVDIRKVGSGNAGGTNALRTQGWVFALGVVIIDIGKGAVGAGDGCGEELAVWLDPNRYRPGPPPTGPFRYPREATINDLPPACRGVLAAGSDGVDIPPWPWAPVPRLRPATN